MSLDIVGKENLPNVYIKEVSVEELDSYKIIASPVVYLKDLKTKVLDHGMTPKHGEAIIEVTSSLLITAAFFILNHINNSSSHFLRRSLPRLSHATY